MKKHDMNYVTSSELAEYIYCECCWWDKREDLHEETDAMKHGIVEHVRMQNSLLNIFSIKFIAMLVFGLGLLMLLVLLASVYLGLL
jgi:hypothetical protein